MARNNARGRSSGAKRRSSTRGHSSGRGWRLYGAGVLTGLFASFLLYLGMLPRPADTPPPAEEQAEAPAPKPRFDFYPLLPEQTIEVEVQPREVEPARELGKPPPAQGQAQVYVLQAGAFRQRDDADRRRAELLLLGLAPSISETSGDNGRLFRVYLGPFDSLDAMKRARGLTAAQGIDTLLLKRNAP